jgi:hypothetical protein
VPGQRADAHPGQVVGQPKAVQDARRVGADLDARADLTDRRGALVDVDVEARLQERQRSRDPADPAADDGDRGAGRLSDAPS